MEASLLLCLCLMRTPPEEEALLLAEFEKLPSAGQASLLQEVEAAVRSLDLPLGRLVEKIVGRQEAPKEPLETWTGPLWYDPKIYAPALPIPRKLLAEDDPKTAPTRQKFWNNRVPDELGSSLRYSFGTNRILQLWRKTPPATTLRNYLAGYPPGADLAREIVLKLLDDDPKVDAEADYFEHAYSDREGNVYPGITLFDVWNSGHEMEMPDVDAIPFARHILKDASYRSPIPAGPKRTALYRKIGEHFASFRRYVQLRQAAASYFLAWSPKVSPFVEPMRDRIHLLIAWGVEEPFLLSQFFRKHPEREDFLEAADALIEELGSQASSLIETRKIRLESDHRSIRGATLQLLRKKLGRD